MAQLRTPRDWDVFISHASEDKETVAKPLTDALNARGIRVWFDAAELRIGDSLRRKIDEGLANSRYGVVILSQSFLAKDWPQYELNGILARKIDGDQRLLPIMHRISRAEIGRYSPPLLDTIACNTETSTIEEIARERSDRVRSDRSSETPLPAEHPHDDTQWPTLKSFADSIATSYDSTIPDDLTIQGDLESVRRINQSIRERRVESIGIRDEQLRQTSYEIEIIGTEIDGRLAESDFVMVNELVRQAVGVINYAADDCEDLDELCRLGAVKLQDESESKRTVEPGLDAFYRIVKPELPTPGGTAGRSLHDNDEVEVSLEEMERQRDKCADRMRALLNHFAFDLWFKALDFAKEGNAEALAEIVNVCNLLTDHLQEAYDTWILWLNALYINNPMNLGSVGDIIRTSTTWLVNEYGESTTLDDSTG